MDEWKKWGTYHKGAENSTGFRKETAERADHVAEGGAGAVVVPGGGSADGAAAQKSSGNRNAANHEATDTAVSEQERAQTTKADKKKQLPEDVTDTIERCMETYNYLFDRRTIKAPGQTA